MTVTKVEVGKYLKFIYTNAEGVTTTIDKKDGDIITISTSDKKYTGRIAEVNKDSLNLDISEQYKSNIITIKYDDINKVVEV